MMVPGFWGKVMRRRPLETVLGSVMRWDSAWAGSTVTSYHEHESGPSRVHLVPSQRSDGSGGRGESETSRVASKSVEEKRPRLRGVKSRPGSATKTSSTVVAIAT